MGRNPAFICLKRAVCRDMLGGTGGRAPHFGHSLRLDRGMFDKSDMSVLAVGFVAVALGLALVDARQPFAGPPVDVATADLPLVAGGVPLGAAPRQVDIANVSVDLGAGFAAEILDSYVLTGRVVTRKPYRFDAVSKVSPLDLGIIYGELLDPEYDDRVRYRTGPRMIWFQADDNRTMPDDWEDLVTNNHLIPIDAAVKAALMAVEVGQAVQIRGYLVSVTGGGLRPWRSSRVRSDGFPAGCEIILVRSMTVLPQVDAEQYGHVIPK